MKGHKVPCIQGLKTNMNLQKSVASMLLSKQGLAFSRLRVCFQL